LKDATETAPSDIWCNGCKQHADKRNGLWYYLKLSHADILWSFHDLSYSLHKDIITHTSFAHMIMICTYVVIYIYVAVRMFCAVRCVIIICCYLLFYLQLCSCKYVLCSTLCHYYLLLSVILFTVM
jgi:hypothetical protein